MKLNEELAPYEKDFNNECSKIKLFCSSLKEIKFQIELLEKICGKELEIYEKQASIILNLLKSFNENIFTLNSEPSNLFIIISDLITLIDTNFLYMRLGLIDCYTNFKNNIPIITKSLDDVHNEIYIKSISLLKESRQKNSKENLNDYLNQIIETVVINIFKGLVYMHQLFFMYSKAKNDLNIKIKNTSEEKSNNKVIDIVINDFSERKLAKENLGIHYEPLHFGNHNYDILVRNDSENILSLCDSYLYYGQIFIKCIKIRKKLISQFQKLMKDILTQSPEKITEKIIHIRDKIQKTKENFKILGFGTDKSWDLLISSWTQLYNTINIFFVFYKEVVMNDLKENGNGKNDEYKAFEDEWAKISKKIIELRNKYKKYYTPEKKSEIKENQKELKQFLEKENQIKLFLNGECYDFLNSNVPIIREAEKQKAVKIQEYCLRFKKFMNKTNEENIKNSLCELENSSSIDIYQEVKDIFNKQNNILKIKDIDNYMEQLKSKILSKLDFEQDNLSQNFKYSLDNYFKKSEELNGLINISLSDSAFESLKEFQSENDGNNINEKENNNINNNPKINNNDIISLPSTSLNKINSDLISKSNFQSKEIITNLQNNYLNINTNKTINEQKENITTNNNNNSSSKIINESSFIKDINSENLPINLIDNNINTQLAYLNNLENGKHINEILDNYYKDPLIKNNLINRSKEVYTMLNEIHFFERLAKASQDRMNLFEKEFKKGLYFRSQEEFENIFINEKDIKSTSPLTLIFHYIFNPKTVIKEYPQKKSFFETIFTMRGDYNLNLIYDKLEIDKIPKYFNDFDYVNNLFNNYNRNDLDLFLKSIDTWYKKFQFQINFTHPIQKIIWIPEKISIRDVANIYFVSPTDLIVDYLSFGIDFPFSEKFVSSAQYRFHCDIKYNKNLGRFSFKTSLIVYNKVDLLSEFGLADILHNEAYKNNQQELQINTLEPLRKVVESQSKENEVEANKIFVKNLRNTIFSYSEKKPDDYDTNNEDDSSTSEYESSSDGKNKILTIKNKKKRKRNNNDNLYYGILIILGLLTIKTIFSINNGFFSFDNLLNVLILISICVVLYTSKK